MDVLAAIRRLILREHEQEHEEIGQELTEMRAELTAQEVALRRLEARAALRRKYDADRGPGP